MSTARSMALAGPSWDNETVARRLEEAAYVLAREAGGVFCFANPPLPIKPLVHRPPGFRSAAAVKRELDRQRPSAARRGYGPRWCRARAAYLERHPLCV